MFDGGLGSGACRYTVERDNTFIISRLHTGPIVFCQYNTQTQKSAEMGISETGEEYSPLV